MTTPELGKLEPVPVRKVWGLEADFTTWLADNLRLLGEVLDMDMELIEKESSLRGAGTVDILAKDKGNDAKVIIENQLEYSNDDHFARLIGYAASRDARILIWVANGFSNWHIHMLDWLNEENGINAYGVVVSAWRVVGSYAPFFEVVAAPERQGNLVSPQSRRYDPYDAFYQPLVDALSGKGIIRIPRGRRGGWYSKWRAFETGYNDIFYGLSVDDDGAASAFLQIETENRQMVFDALGEYRDQIANDIVESQVQWYTYDNCLNIGVEMDTAMTPPIDASGKDGGTRTWMRVNLVKLRNAIQPHLDNIMSELQSDEASS